MDEKLIDLLSNLGIKCMLIACAITIVTSLIISLIIDNMLIFVTTILTVFGWTMICRVTISLMTRHEIHKINDEVLDLIHSEETEEDIETLLN